MFKSGIRWNFSKNLFQFCRASACTHTLQKNNIHFPSKISLFREWQISWLCFLFWHFCGRIGNPSMRVWTQMKMDQWRIDWLLLQIYPLGGLRDLQFQIDGQWFWIARSSSSLWVVDQYMTMTQWIFPIFTILKVVEYMLLVGLLHFKVVRNRLGMRGKQRFYPGAIFHRGIRCKPGW